MNKKLLLFVSIILLSHSQLYSQRRNLTAEDSLNNSLSLESSTSIGGYGSATYHRDFNLKNSTINVDRIVLFVGHNFTRGVSFFSELEVEDAKLSGGEEGGEIALEQAYLKFNIDQHHFFNAGLFIPRIGILNENHLPTTFNGNERNQVETYILPSTWRELGIGFYGSLSGSPLNYSIAVLNGLNSATFEHGSGIRGGRFEGRNASANSLAITGAVQWTQNNLSTQLSGYYGGTVGLPAQVADSLHINSGIFGTPVAVGEVDVQYEISGFSSKILGVVISIPDAEEINRVFQNNTPSKEYGFYAEVAYNLFENDGALNAHRLIGFLRYEKLDLNESVPSNGIVDGTLKQQHIVTGFSYFPINDVVIKADIRFAMTDDQNPILINAQSPFNQPFSKNNTFLNLGIGFSF